MTQNTVSKIAANLTVAQFLVMSNLSLVTAQTSLEDIRKGYACGSLIMPTGDVAVGDNMVWTQSGLMSSFVIYKEDPNRFGRLWREMTISLRDGTTVRTSGIETHNKRNFISVVHRGKVLWVPFDAIKTLVVTEEPKTTLAGLRTDEEVYGRFRFTKKPYPSAEFTIVVTVDLRFPLKDGQRTLKGWLLDGLGNVGYYTGSGWTSIPWKSVVKVAVDYSTGSDGESRTTTVVPSFVYRMQGDHSNVWKEYSFPKEDE